RHPDRSEACVPRSRSTGVLYEFPVLRVRSVCQRSARALRQAGHLVCHLGFGESPFPVPPSMVEALKAHAGEKAYLPGEGLPELREAAAAFLRRQGHELHAANILVGPGSKELLFDLLAILAGPVLVPVPAWVRYAPRLPCWGNPLFPWKRPGRGAIA
ncbi:MAG: aminotransferase class I/II-fold pyridoxal phosphate-dependent enzyme, partial [Pseudomonadales bacterium]